MGSGHSLLAEMRLTVEQLPKPSQGQKQCPQAALGVRQASVPIRTGFPSIHGWEPLPDLGASSPCPSMTLLPRCPQSSRQALLRLGLVNAKTGTQGCHVLAGSDAGDALEYNPNLLDDPQWPCGKHKRVLIFASYMVRRAPPPSGHQQH